MQFLISILQRLLGNPKTLGYAIILGSTLITKKSNFMEHSTTSDHTTAEPLFLPRGTVRAIIALALTALVITSFVLPEKITLPEEVLMIWIGAVGYYLGFRTDNAKTREIKV